MKENNEEVPKPEGDLSTKIADGQTDLSIKTSDDQTKSPDDQTQENPMKILEDALVLCKFGRFHIQLMITSLLSVIATTAVTTVTSYILPSAECDLGMSNLQKGLLNSMPFLGQFSASLFTGFLADAFGRKIFLVGGNCALFVFAVFGGISQTYPMLLVAKVLEGVIMSMVFTATPSMISEFTHKNVRDRVMMAYAAFMSISLITMALVPWGVLSLQRHFVFLDGNFVIHPWNVYLLVNSIWSLLAAILYWQLPESPKYLFSHGQENEALDILKKVYRINTGKPEDTFPITSLNSSGIYKPTSKTSFKKTITGALFDVKELFYPPLVFKLALFCTTTFVCLLSFSALRLWFPQLSTFIETYQKEHDGNGGQFCEMITYKSPIEATLVSETGSTSNMTDVCIPHISGPDTYTNGAILGLVSLIFISLSGYLVDFFGQKPLMGGFISMCALCSIVLYWTTSSIQVAILISLTCGFMQAAFSLQNSIIVRVFPTTVRTIALSVMMMVGRAGSLIGNILFPIMLEAGCMVPFITLAVVSLTVGCVVYFLPNPRKENISGDK